MNKYKLKFDFEFGECNGFMQLQIIHNDIVIEVLPDQNNTAVIELEILLPAKIQLSTSGKGPNDTKQDDDGNITADKFVKINNIKLENFDLDEQYLWKYLGSRDENNIWHEGSYFGFNSDMLIEFNETDVMAQFLECNFICIYEESPKPTFKERKTRYGIYK